MNVSRYMAANLHYEGLKWVKYQCFKLIRYIFLLIYQQKLCYGPENKHQSPFITQYTPLWFISIKTSCSWRKQMCNRQRRVLLTSDSDTCYPKSTQDRTPANIVLTDCSTWAKNEERDIQKVIIVQLRRREYQCQLKKNKAASNLCHLFSKYQNK